MSEPRTRRSGRQLLGYRASGKASDGQQAIKVESTAGLGGKTCHGGADEVRQALCLFRVTRGNVDADHVLRGRVEGAGGRAGFLVIATCAFQHEAASSSGIGSIAPGGLFQHRRQAFGDRAVRPQQVRKGNCFGNGVAFENASVEAGFVAESGVEAGRVDANGCRNVRYADSIVAARVEQALGSSHTLVGIEAAWTTARAQFICSDHYIFILTSAAGDLCSIYYVNHQGMQMSIFQGKSVLVLGGSRGIGAAIVRRFAAEGAAVTFTYAGSRVAADQLAAETGSTAVLTDSANRDAVIARVRESGPLDVLVVNAGIGVFGDALEQDPDVIDRLFQINIQAPYHASVEAARQMPEGGRIIVIGSVNGDRMPVPGMASYAVSKSALQGLARGLARDFGPRGITINIVQPGPIDTDANPENGPMKDLMHSFMAIKRHGRPEEVAGMVAWLAGPEAGFVTGAMHTIDGAFGA